MRKLAIVSTAAFVGVLLAATAAVQVKAGPELVKFPANKIAALPDNGFLNFIY